MIDRLCEYLMEKDRKLNDWLDNKIKWFLDAIDGEYDPDLEDDIIVKMYRQMKENPDKRPLKQVRKRRCKGDTSWRYSRHQR